MEREEGLRAVHCHCGGCGESEPCWETDVMGGGGVGYSSVDLFYVGGCLDGVRTGVGGIDEGFEALA